MGWGFKKAFLKYQLLLSEYCLWLSLFQLLSTLFLPQPTDGMMVQKSISQYSLLLSERFFFIFHFYKYSPHYSFLSLQMGWGFKKAFLNINIFGLLESSGCKIFGFECLPNFLRQTHQSRLTHNCSGVLTPIWNSYSKFLLFHISFCALFWIFHYLKHSLKWKEMQKVNLTSLEITFLSEGMLTDYIVLHFVELIWLLTFILSFVFMLTEYI